MVFLFEILLFIIFISVLGCSLYAFFFLFDANNKSFLKGFLRFLVIYILASYINVLFNVLYTFLIYVEAIDRWFTNDVSFWVALGLVTLLSMVLLYLFHNSYLRKKSLNLL